MLSRISMPWSTDDSLPDALHDTVCLLYMVLYYYLMLSLLSPRTHKCFAAEPYPSQCVPSLFCDLNLFHFRCSSYLSLLKLTQFLLVQFFSIQRFLWMIGGSSFSDVSPSLHFEVICKLRDGSVLSLEYLQIYWIALPDPASTFKEHRSKDH